jgi:hypothetical protein
MFFTKPDEKEKLPYFDNTMFKAEIDNNGDLTITFLKDARVTRGEQIHLAVTMSRPQLEAGLIFDGRDHK